MSYLLTEVAMEMLGWRFYDADGVARPINFASEDNEICEGVENLASLIGASQPINCMSSPATSVVKAEADSSSKVAYQTFDVIDVDADPCPVTENDPPFNGAVNIRSTNDKVTGLSPQNLGNFNEPYAMGQPANGTPHPHNMSQQLKDTPIAIDTNTTDATDTTLPLKIQHVEGGYEATEAKDTSTKVTSDTGNIQQPQFSIVKVTSADTDGQASPKVLKSKTTNNRNLTHQYNFGNPTSEYQKSVSAIIDLTDEDRNVLGTEQELDFEANKIVNDLKRQKSEIFEAVPDVLKQQGTLKSCRERAYKNLQNELKNLQALREEAEHESYADFKQTYSKYIDISQKLFAYKQNSAMTSRKATLPPKSKKPVARKKTSPAK